MIHCCAERTVVGPFRPDRESKDGGSGAFGRVKSSGRNSDSSGLELTENNHDLWNVQCQGLVAQG